MALPTPSNIDPNAGIISSARTQDASVATNGSQTAAKDPNRFAGTQADWTSGLPMPSVIQDMRDRYDATGSFDAPNAGGASSATGANAGTTSSASGSGLTQQQEIDSAQSNVNNAKLTEAQARVLYGDAGVDNAIAKGIKFSSGDASSASSGGNGSPSRWNVTSDQTVRGQLKDIVDPNSALGQQAVTQGLQMANDRGLINSSIAQTAAQDALYKNALPIAQQDAGTFAKAAGYNTDIANQFAMKDKDINAQYGLADKNINAQRTLAQMNIDATKALNISNQELTRLTQGNSAAAAAVNNLTTGLAAIDRDTNITDPAAKKIAKDNLVAATKAALQMIGASSGDYDYASFLDSLGL